MERHELKRRSAPRNDVDRNPGRAGAARGNHERGCGNYIGRGEKAKADAAKIEIGQIGQTLDLYKLEIGRYPTTQEGLQALISAPAGVNNWNGPYWKKQSVPKDPWGNEYKYVSPAQSAPYEIISLGADGKEGGDGPNKDIVSTQ